jgi:hypothetical protein
MMNKTSKLKAAATLATVPLRKPYSYTDFDPLPSVTYVRDNKGAEEELERFAGYVAPSHGQMLC